MNLPSNRMKNQHTSECIEDEVKSFDVMIKSFLSIWQAHCFVSMAFSFSRFGCFIIEIMNKKRKKEKMLDGFVQSVFEERKQTKQMNTMFEKFEVTTKWQLIFGVEKEIQRK